MLKGRQQFSLIWIVASVLLLFIGMIVSAAGSLSGLGNLGLIMTVTANISILLYIFYSAFQWFRFKKGDGLSNLVTAYIILAMLFTFGGLIGAFLTFPDAFYFFFAGLGMFALYWFYILFKNILKKEEVSR